MQKFRERRAAALDTEAALVASYVADYRVSLAVARKAEAAALWLLADALEELSDAEPGDIRAVAAALHGELRRRGVAT